MTALTAAEQGLVDEAVAFTAAHVRPHVAARTDSREVLRAAAATGLLGLEVPTEHGGLGLSFACKWRVAEVLAPADFGLAMSLINTHNVANHLARSAAPEVAQRYVPNLLAGQRTGCTALTEPGAASDLAALAATADRDGDDWVINGEKWFVTSEGDAGISMQHALVLVNHGRATGAELLSLARRVAESVEQRFEVRLEPEPRIVGDHW